MWFEAYRPPTRTGRATPGNVVDLSDLDGRNATGPFVSPVGTASRPTCRANSKDCDVLRSPHQIRFADRPFVVVSN